MYLQWMIKAKPKAMKRLREGYDPPLLVYLRHGTRAAIRAKKGPRSEAKAIRELLEKAYPANG